MGSPAVAARFTAVWRRRLVADLGDGIAHEQLVATNHRPMNQYRRFVSQRGGPPG
jgi:hypothetical protein